MWSNVSIRYVLRGAAYISQKFESTCLVEFSYFCCSATCVLNYPPIYHAARRYCRSHLGSPRVVIVCRKLRKELHVRMWSDLRWPMTDTSNIGKIVQQLSS